MRVIYDTEILVYILNIYMLIDTQLFTTYNTHFLFALIANSMKFIYARCEYIGVDSMMKKKML